MIAFMIALVFCLMSFLAARSGRHTARNAAVGAMLVMIVAAFAAGPAMATPPCVAVPGVAAVTTFGVVPFGAVATASVPVTTFAVPTTTFSVAQPAAVVFSAAVVHPHRQPFRAFGRCRR